MTHNCLDLPVCLILLPLPYVDGGRDGDVLVENVRLDAVFPYFIVD